MTIATDPVQVFNHLNRFLCEHAGVGRYATMFFSILDRDGKLLFIGAGHPSPLILRKGEVVDLFTEGSFPVGLIAEATFEASTATLRPGDTMVLFSDGVTEAMDPEEQMYGVSRLREVLSGRHDEPLEELQSTVLRSVETFARGASQADDITVLFVRYGTAAAQVAS
jgi:sigma-B regulation protein RsbU (phosphoserine phosphatase)